MTALAPSASPEPLPRGAVALFGLAWAAFAAWCVSGIPPSVDLPAHGAQMQTLAGLLRGDPALAGHYTWQFPLGYGLHAFLFLPVTWLTSGATAAKAAAWCALVGLPLAHLALLRAAGRSGWAALFALPLAFNLSYWYGFLPTLFALPFVLLGWAAFLRALQAGARGAWRRAGGWTAGLVAAATVCVLSHLVAFAALLTGVAALALASRPRGRALGLAGVGLLPPLLLVGARVVVLASRVGDPGAVRPTLYGWAEHLHTFTKAYRPGAEGLLAVAAPLLVTVAFSAAWAGRRRVEPRAPVALALALAGLYVVTPKSVAGAWMVHARLPVLVALASLLLVEPASLSRWGRALALTLSLASLAETARFHWRFGREMEGLTQLLALPPPRGPHGYVSLAGRSVLGSRISYADHLGQWWTARHGGVGHHFFAREDQHPVRFVSGGELPDEVVPEDADRLAAFRALLVYGDGPLPPSLASFTVTAQAGRWRRLERVVRTEPHAAP